MEKIETVKMISRHWECSDKNVYKLMKNDGYQKKLQIIKLGCICRENNISEQQLLDVIQFINKAKGYK